MCRDMGRGGVVVEYLRARITDADEHLCLEQYRAEGVEERYLFFIRD